MRSQEKYPWASRWVNRNFTNRNVKGENNEKKSNDFEKCYGNTRRRGYNRTEKIFEEIMKENFPKLNVNTKPWNKKLVQKKPNRRYRYFVLKL